MARIFPIGKYRNQGRCKALLLHTKAVLLRWLSRSNCLEDQALVCINTAQYIWETGNLVAAKRMAQKALDIRKLILSEDNLATLVAMYYLCIIYCKQGKYKEATSANKTLVRKRTQILRRENTKILKSIYNLANCYQELVRHTEATQMHKEVLSVRKRVIGKEYLDTLKLLRDVAECNQKKGKRKVVIDMYKSIQKAWKQILKEKYPNTLESTYNLALCYQYQGD